MGSILSQGTCTGNAEFCGFPVMHPRRVGFDPEPLERLRAELRGMVEEGRFPGFVCAVASSSVTRGNEPSLAFADAFGLQDVERGVLATQDTVWRLYSMTKAIVCVALMSFFEEGKVHLHDPVSKFLGPAWSKDQVSVAGKPKGIIAGENGELKERLPVKPGDSVFLVEPGSNGRHLDVDPSGDCKVRWRDRGAWQILRVVKPADCFGANKAVALQSHTGYFLDVDFDSPWPCEAPGVRASSTLAVPWIWKGSCTCEVDDMMVSGCRIFLQHQGTGRYLTVREVDNEGGKRQVVVGAECCGDSSIFILEKQTWSLDECQRCTQDIEIRHLMTHTSGLDYAGLEERYHTALDAMYRPLTEACDRSDINSIAEWTSKVAKLPRAFQPGQRHEYGYSIDVLGRVCEVLAGGKPLEKVLQERVLGPLGMTSTGFGVAAPVAAKRLAALYRLKPDPHGCSGKRKREVLDDPWDSDWAPPRGPCPVQGGGGGVCTVKGGLVSTAEDYLRFALMLLQGGEFQGRRVLQRSTVELMTAHNHLADVLKTQDTKLGNNPAGWNLLGALQIPHPKAVYDVGHFTGNFWWGGWAGTAFRVSPSTQTVFVFMSNCIDSGGAPEDLIARRIGEALRGRWGCRWLRLHQCLYETRERLKSLGVDKNAMAIFLTCFASAVAMYGTQFVVKHKA